MRMLTHFALISLWLSACTAWSASPPPSPASTNTAATAQGGPKETTAGPQILQACLALQEQLRAAQRAMEEARGEAKSAAKASSDLMAERFKGLEQTLASLRLQMERQMAAFSATNAELARQFDRQRELEQQLRTSLAELKEIQVALQKETTRRTQLEDEIRQTNQQLTGIRSELRDETTRRSLSDQHAAFLTATNLQISLQLAQKTEAEASARRLGDRLERRLEQTASLLAEARNRIQELTASLDRTRQDWVQLQVTNTIMGRDLAERSQAQSEFQQLRKNLEGRLQSADQTLAQTRFDLRASQESAARLWIGCGCLAFLLLVGVAVLWHSWRRPDRWPTANRRIVVHASGPIEDDAAQRIAPVQPPGQARPTAAASAPFQAPSAPAQHAGCASPPQAPQTASLPPEALAPTTPSPAAPLPASPVPSSSPVALLLRQGQALVEANHVETALACFDKALGVSPDNAEIHLRRGSALERADRGEEAIAAYDRAIALDPSMTMAYLLKGGALTRLNRSAEAAECYQQAVEAQRKHTLPAS